ncbi:MAG: hypothetical protein KC535_00965 [Nanoarchaeota archaeon]|nr:hypothetical protein [Nanoarchaeota archaeon]
MNAKQYWGDIAKTPILAITIFAISLIAIMLDAPLIIPTFAASLFTLVILQHGHSVRVVIGSHCVAFILALFAPLLLHTINFIPELFLAPAVYGLIVFVASLIFTITRLEHAPAIASTIIFFEAGKQGTLLFGIVPLHITLAFAAGLFIVALTAKYTALFHKKEFKEF